MTDTLQQIASNLYEGDDKKVAELVQLALDQGIPSGDILSGGIIAGMDEMGKDFKAGELFMPEVLIAARAMHAGMNILRPPPPNSHIACRDAPPRSAAATPPSFPARLVYPS
jgi:5-methyltetrahydrofolate--homocysteine methyltransferase